MNKITVQQKENTTVAELSDVYPELYNKLYTFYIVDNDHEGTDEESSFLGMKLKQIRVALHMIADDANEPMAIRKQVLGMIRQYIDWLYFPNR